jgi:hypothetical protein
MSGEGKRGIMKGVSMGQSEIWMDGEEKFSEFIVVMAKKVLGRLPMGALRGPLKLQIWARLPSCRYRKVQGQGTLVSRYLAACPTTITYLGIP